MPASCAGLRLHEALQRLQPERYPSVTSAKTAVSLGWRKAEGQADHVLCLHNRHDL